MPTAALRPCTGSPRCPHFLGQCPTHTRKPDHHVRGTAQARGYNYRWSQYSQSFLEQHPICGEQFDGRMDPTHSKCLQAGRVTPSACTDHIVPVSKGGSFWDAGNHQALCLACNSAKGDR